MIRVPNRTPFPNHKPRGCIAAERLDGPERGQRQGGADGEDGGVLGGLQDLDPYEQLTHTVAHERPEDRGYTHLQEYRVYQPVRERASAPCGGRIRRRMGSRTKRDSSPSLKPHSAKMACHNRPGTFLSATSLVAVGSRATSAASRAPADRPPVYRRDREPLATTASGNSCATQFW